MIMYPVCVYPKITCVEIELPDFNFSVKGHDMITAMSSAVETVTALYRLRLVKGKDIPTPSELSDIKLKKRIPHGFKTLVYVDITT